MAKIKVHEIAKELEKQSKEIIAFLQDKGIEVKAAQSALEEEAAEMVRKAFGRENAGKAGQNALEKQETKASQKPEQKAGAKSDGAAQQSPKPAQEDKKQPRQETKPEGREKAQGQAGGEAPRRKKKIIVVSNPHNSNIPGQRSQASHSGSSNSQGNHPNGAGEKKQGQPKQAQQKQGQQKPGQAGRQGAGGGNRQNQPNQNRRQGQGGQKKEVPHKIIRPLTAPSIPESMQVDFKLNAQKLENERIAAKNAQAAREAEAKAAKEAAEAKAAQEAAAAKAAQEERAAKEAAEKKNAQAARPAQSASGRPSGRQTGDPGSPREMKGVKEMTGIRGMRGLRRAAAVAAAKAKGMPGAMAEGPKGLTVWAARAAGLISGVITLIGIITGLGEIITATREALRGRTIDLNGVRSQVKVSFRKPPLRMKSAGMTRSAGSARRRIKSLKKTLSMKRMTVQ